MFCMCIPYRVSVWFRIRARISSDSHVTLVVSWPCLPSRGFMPAHQLILTKCPPRGFGQRETQIESQLFSRGITVIIASPAGLWSAPLYLINRSDFGPKRATSKISKIREPRTKTTRDTLMLRNPRGAKPIRLTPPPRVM